MATWYRPTCLIFQPMDLTVNRCSKAGTQRKFEILISYCGWKQSGITVALSKGNVSLFSVVQQKEISVTITCVLLKRNECSNNMCFIKKILV